LFTVFSLTGGLVIAEEIAGCNYNLAQTAGALYKLFAQGGTVSLV
jgi:hypothetical protein